MASLTISNLDDPLTGKLRLRATRHGRSMEDEARDILRAALSVDDVPPLNMAEAIRRRFAPLGGVDLPTIPRDPLRPSPGVDE